MNHEQAFLQAILSSPDDDSLRLIYADWLEERGDASSRARAEFIRVQFALHDLPPEHPLRPQLEARERELRLANETHWIGPLRAQCRFHRCEFRRGFVEKVALSFEDWAAQADTFFTLTPIREVEFPDIFSLTASGSLPKDALTPRLRQLTALYLPNWSYVGQDNSPIALLSSPHLSGLQHLTVSARLLMDPRVGMLLNFPFLSNLTSLSLKHLSFGGWNLEELFRSDRLSNLKALDLCEACWGNRARGMTLLRQLVAGADLANLSTLDLRGNGLDSAAARMLTRANLLPRLESLYLGRNPVGDRGVAALAKSGLLRRLRLLDLSASQIGSAGLSALAECPTLERLSVLHLRANRLGDAGMGPLCGAPALADLSVLHLSSTGIGAAGARSLAQSPPGQLTTLDLSWNPLTEEGVRALAASPALERLTALDLSYCQLGDDAARALADSPYLNNLNTLNFSTNRITDAGIEALSRSSGLPSLTLLNLGYNAISDASLQCLAASPRWRRLTALNLAGNRIAADRLNEPRQNFPGCLGDDPNTEHVGRGESV